MSEERFTAKNVAELLKITTTNLKHYASLLEQNGLNLFRNTRNHREYSQKDVKLLQALQILNRQKSMVLEEAASFVMSSDTNINAILNLDNTLIVAKNNTKISVLSQDSEDNLHNIILTLQDELEKRDAIHIEYLSKIEEKLIKQLEENVKLNLTLIKINEELTQIKSDQAKNLLGKLFKSFKK